MNIRSGAVTLIAIVAVAAVAWFLVDGARVPGVAPANESPGASHVLDRAPADAQGRTLRDAGNHASAPGVAPAAGTGTERGQASGAGAVVQPPPSSGPGPQAPGLRMLSAEGAQRIAEVIAAQRKRDTDFDDVHFMLENEPRDAAWAEAAEARISEFLRVEGAGYSGLEVAPPRCSATVCGLSATALPGLEMDAPHANWQKLMFLLGNQPWFRTAFDGPELLVTDRDGATVYVATFMRLPE